MWAKDQGIIMPKLKFPTTFENDIIGISCTSEIKHHEAFLFIPFKMMLTVNKILDNPILGPLIESNPKCFSDKSG